MRKDILFIITMCMMGIFILTTLNVKGDASQEEIANKLIRFHVIANSDEEFDQNLKLKVRDEILKYISPKLKDSKNIEESRNILMKEDKKVKEIARKVIKENGYNYAVKAELSKEYFPVKTYGNITLPQGKYEAYRVIIGSGEGKNWWCVMFPPLCFVDITNGNVSYSKTEKQMKRVLSKSEYKLIDNTTKKNPVVVKLKLKEMISKIF